MDPRRQAENQIHLHSGRDGGIQDRRVMREMRPGYKTMASGPERSACLHLGGARGVRSDSGGCQGPERGPEYETRPSAPEGTGRRCRDLRRNGAPFSSPSPGAPGEGVHIAWAGRLRSLVAAGCTSGRCMRHSTGIPLGVIECAALCLSAGDRYQGSALQEWRTGRQICIPTRWRQDLCWLLSAQKSGTTLVV